MRVCLEECVGSEGGLNSTEVVGPELVGHDGIGVVTGGHGLELFHGEVGACVDGLKSAIGVDTDAIDAMGGGVGKGDLIGGDAKDFDLVIGIKALDDVGLFTVGAVASLVVPPVVEVLVGLDGDEIDGAIDLAGVGVPTEVTVEFIGARAAGDDVASVAAVNEVVTAFGIDDFPTAETVKDVIDITALEDGASDLDVLRGGESSGIEVELFGLEVGAIDASTSDAVDGEGLLPRGGVNVH